MGKARKRSHGHGTVFVRPNGRFTAQITNDGKRRSIGTFATRDAAERALSAALVEDAKTALEVTFGEYLRGWLDGRPLVVKPTTAARDRNVVTRYVLPLEISKRSVGDLEPKHFRVLYRNLATSGKADGTGLAPGTLKTVEQVLRGALQQLVDDRELPWHPMPRRAVKVTASERPHLNVDQLRELIRFARLRYPDLEVVVRLGGLAGLRRGEMCGLRWSDVDLVEGTWTIRRNRTVANGSSARPPRKRHQQGAGCARSTDDGGPRTPPQRRAMFIEQDVDEREHVVCAPAGGGLDPNNLARSFATAACSSDTGVAGQPSERSNVPTESATTEEGPLLVGRWQQSAAVHSCSNWVRGMDREGLLTAVEPSPPFHVGETWQQVADDFCDPGPGDYGVEHSHFFDQDGNFGSLDQHSDHVDEGSYEIVNEHTMRIGRARSARGQRRHADVGSGHHTRCPQGGLAKPGKFTEAVWMVSVAFPGESWQRGECESWC